MLSFGSPTRGANLDQPQQLHLFDPKPYETKTPPKPRPMAEGQPFFEPPSDIVVYAYCEGQVVILAQQAAHGPRRRRPEALVYASPQGGPSKVAGDEDRVPYPREL